MATIWNTESEFRRAYHQELAYVRTQAETLLEYIGEDEEQYEKLGFRFHSTEYSIRNEGNLEAHKLETLRRAFMIKTRAEYYELFKPQRQAHEAALKLLRFSDKTLSLRRLEEEQIEMRKLRQIMFDNRQAAFAEMTALDSFTRELAVANINEFSTSEIWPLRYSDEGYPPNVVEWNYYLEWVNALPTTAAILQNVNTPSVDIIAVRMLCDLKEEFLDETDVLSENSTSSPADSAEEH